MTHCLLLCYIHTSFEYGLRQEKVPDHNTKLFRCRLQLVDSIKAVQLLCTLAEHPCLNHHVRRILLIKYRCIPALLCIEHITCDKESPFRTGLHAGSGKCLPPEVISSAV